MLCYAVLCSQSIGSGVDLDDIAPHLRRHPALISPMLRGGSLA
jgi:hypothetical protein